jgi:hypothetical protein
MRRIVFSLLIFLSVLGANAQPTNVTIGTANAGAGDTLFQAFTKVNANINYVYALATNSSGGAGKLTIASNLLDLASIPAARSNLVAETRRVFNAADYGFTNTASGAANALVLSNVIRLASTANGGVVYLPSGQYTNASLDISASNFRLIGDAVLVPSGVMTQWLKFTGTNFSIGGEGSGLDFNGNDQAMQLLTVGAYSAQFKINNNIIRRGRVTVANDDPSATVSNSVNTAYGIRLLEGSTNGEIAGNFIYDIAYDGNKTYISGLGRTAVYVLMSAGGFTATNDLNAIRNIKISDNWFVSTRSDDHNNKPDIDGVRIQNMQSDAVTNNAILIQGNHFVGNSWKGVKAQASDVTVDGNFFRSYGNVEVSGTNVVPRAAIELFGRNCKAINNTISGIYEWAIACYSDPIHGQVIGGIISGNLINMPADLSSGSSGIFLKSVQDYTVNNNNISAARNGIRLQGDTRHVSLSGNFIGTNSQAAVFIVAETDATDSWFGFAPSNIVVKATTAANGTRGIWASDGARNITIDRPSGNTSAPIFYSGDATGSLVLEIDPAAAPTGVLNTSAELAAILSDETGSGGGFVRATSPTFTTPTLGVASATGRAYDATSWNGSARVPTEDDIRDKIESMGAGGTAIYVAAASVTNPNFVTEQFAVNASTNVVIKSAASVTNLVSSGKVTLTDAATVATDASTGSHFKVTLGGNRTLGNPTNGKDGQRAVWELIQDGTGSRIITMDTKFAFGTDITGITLSTTASKRDFLTAIYDSTADRWHVVGFVRGY